MNCNCTLNIVTPKDSCGRIEYRKGSEQGILYPPIRVYRTDANTITILGADGRNQTVVTSCATKVDGVNYEDFNLLYRDLIEIACKLNIVNVSDSGSGSTGLATEANQVIANAFLDSITTNSSDALVQLASILASSQNIDANTANALTSLASILAAINNVEVSNADIVANTASTANNTANIAGDTANLLVALNAFAAQNNVDLAAINALLVAIDGNTDNIETLLNGIISQLSGLATEATLSNVSTQLSSLNQESTQANVLSQLQGTLLSQWQFIAGNSLSIQYFTGISASNPSGNTNNISSITFLQGATVVLTQSLTYDINDNVLTVTAS